MIKLFLCALFTISALFCVSCDMPERKNECDPYSKNYNRSAPSLLTASDGTYNDYIELKWESVDKAKGYAIFRRDEDGAWKKRGESGNPGYIDSAVENKVTYEYCVTALFDDDLNSEFSAPDGGYCDMRPPQKIIASEGTHYDYVQLEWSGVENALSYIVMKKNEQGNSCKLKETDALSYIDTSVGNKVHYEYCVMAVFSEGRNGELSGNVNGWCDMKAPEEFTASDGTSPSSVSLEWKKMERAVSYVVHRLNSEGTWVCIAETGSTSYTDEKTENNVKYEYRLASKFESGIIGDFSSTESGYCLMPRSEVTCSRGAAGDSILISWTSCGDAERYILLRATSENGTYFKVIETASTSYRDVQCEKGTRYWYKVAAQKGTYVESISLSQWGCTRLDAPQNISASKGIGNCTITISFDGVHNAQRYRIYRANADGGFEKIGETGSLLYSDTDPALDGGTFYKYAVSAINGAGEDCSESEKSPSASGLALDQKTIPATALKLNRLIYDEAEGESFMMGDHDIAPPEHPVMLRTSFYISTTEITWDDWRKTLLHAGEYDRGYTISAGQCGDLPGGSESLPVTQLKWYDALLFCNLLSRINGLDPCYYTQYGVLTEEVPLNEAINFDRTKNGYRLPTEAEWEYACRAMSSAAYFWGDGHLVESVTPRAWYANNSGALTGEPKLKSAALLQPNDYGLFDMSGNASEWVFDCYENYPHSVPADPVIYTDSTMRVIRGGSSYSNAGALMSASRSQGYANSCSPLVSFRIAQNAQ